MDGRASLPLWNTSLYDESHSFVWQRGEELVDLLSPQPDERVLDLGCGTGHLTARIAATGATVVGIDSDPGMIEAARRHYPHIAFEVADGTAFEVSRPYDAVFSNAALHWMRPPERVAECIHRALRPGGRL
nr:class I SAM-dependent methyltransferase [Chloroflexia bacterium]